MLTGKSRFDDRSARPEAGHRIAQANHGAALFERAEGQGLEHVVVAPMPEEAPLARGFETPAEAPIEPWLDVTSPKGSI